MHWPGIALYSTKKALSLATKRLDRLHDEGKKKRLSGYELEAYLSGHLADLQGAQEEYDIELTKALVRKANSLYIEIPPRPTTRHGEDEIGIWEHGFVYNEFYLTNKGVSHFKAAIRKDQKENFDSWSRWITLVIGLLGIATAVLALLIKMS